MIVYLYFNWDLGNKYCSKNQESPERKRKQQQAAFSPETVDQVLMAYKNPA